MCALEKKSKAAAACRKIWRALKIYSAQLTYGARRGRVIIVTVGYCAVSFCEKFYNGVTGIMASSKLCRRGCCHLGIIAQRQP